MTTPFDWTCPYCGRDTTITDSFYDNWSERDSLRNTKAGTVSVRHSFIICPNSNCKEFTFTTTTELYKVVHVINQATKFLLLRSWRLIPESTARVFPDYIPRPILADYNEACRISELSPKASATLARRCLQGMIRDFWKIKKKNLKLEIDALKGKIDSKLYEAIDGLRQIGNIGAHMEKDVNLIIDVEPNESKMLIGLIELLLKEWYIDRHDREENLGAIVALKDAKKVARSKPGTTAMSALTSQQSQLPQSDDQEPALPPSSGN
jgi:uncharacterized protein DUF4145